MLVKNNLILFSLLITLSLSAQNQLISPFVGDITQNQASTNFLMAQPTTNNVNYINLDLSILNNLNNLQLTFQSENYTVTNNGIKQRGYQNYSWFGTNTSGDGYIILSVLGNDVQGIIRKGIETYNIYTAANGAKAIVQYDQSQNPIEYCVFDNTPVPKTNTTNHNTLQNTLKTAADVGCPLRGLILYTPAAAMGMSGSGIMLTDIENAIQAAIEEMNLSFNESQITDYDAVEVALMRQLNFVEDTIITNDLNTIMADATINNLRDTYDADFTVLITAQTYGFCGVAGNVEASRSRAFCIVPHTCMASQLSLAHEVGHLLGADHNFDDRAANVHTYGYGYIYFPGKWRTIMSYNASPCGSGANFCRRQAYWSNPDVLHPVDMVPMGTIARENNARVCRDYNNVCASFEDPENTFI